MRKLSRTNEHRQNSGGTDKAKRLQIRKSGNGFANDFLVNVNSVWQFNLRARSSPLLRNRIVSNRWKSSYWQDVSHRLVMKYDYRIRNRQDRVINERKSRINSTMTTTSLIFWFLSYLKLNRESNLFGPMTQAFHRRVDDKLTKFRGNSDGLPGIWNMKIDSFEKWIFSMEIFFKITS